MNEGKKNAVESVTFRVSILFHSAVEPKVHCLATGVLAGPKRGRLLEPFSIKIWMMPRRVPK